MFWPGSDSGLVIVLGTWALTVIGTMFSALTVNLRIARTDAADAGLSADDSGADGGHDADHGSACRSPLARRQDGAGLRILVAFDIIFTLLSVAFVDTVIVG